MMYPHEPMGPLGILFAVLGGGLHLAKDHAVIMASRLHELRVGSTLDDAALFHQKDGIGAPDS